MKTKQTTHGKAFEYACIIGLEKTINKISKQITGKATINQQYMTCKKHFNSLSKEHKKMLNKGGLALAKKLVMIEPRLIHTTQGLYDEIELTIQSDDKGQGGDVRDVLAVRINAKSKTEGWEIGISCKHGHKALKHQRISPNIDIGKQWVSTPCDDQYKTDIKNLFDKIDNLKKQGKTKWSEIENKDQEIYVPAINAIKSYFERAYKQHGEKICNNLLCYVIGKNDFYKVIIQYKTKKLILQGFNLNNTLNKKADKIDPFQKIPVLHSPTTLHNIQFKKGSKNTVIFVMDEGWQISMRVHNAKTNIENSLKMDVQLIGNPTNLYNETINLGGKPNSSHR